MLPFHIDRILVLSNLNIYWYWNKILDILDISNSRINVTLASHIDQGHRCGRKIPQVSWQVVDIHPHQRQKFVIHYSDDEHDGISNHQPHDCLPNRLFMRRSKKASKLRVAGLCTGNLPVTGEFPAHMASNVGNVPISWRHHDAL